MPGRVKAIWRTMFDNLKNDKNARRYTETKICENSNVSFTETMSTRICPVNMDLDLGTSGLFTDLPNIWISSSLKG